MGKPRTIRRILPRTKDSMMNNKYDLTNIDDIWHLCLSMWRWIKAEIQAGNKKTVAKLKSQWLRENGFTDINENCFFCHYDYLMDNAASCRHCPAREVDGSFNCSDGTNRYDWNPVGFCELIERLNERRE